MKPTARASAITDTAVVEVARRLQRKRALLADHPILAHIAPVNSGQGLLRRFRLGRIDIALSPEITLAKMLKEWHGLDWFYASAKPYRARATTAEEKAVQDRKELNDRIAQVEFRVFGTSPGAQYPEFSCLADWLAWRINLAHPEHQCADAGAGWKAELFDFVIEDAKLSFQS